jgi:hypothetical protein
LCIYDECTPSRGLCTTYFLDGIVVAQTALAMINLGKEQQPSIGDAQINASVSPRFTPLQASNQCHTLAARP